MQHVAVRQPHPAELSPAARRRLDDEILRAVQLGARTNAAIAKQIGRHPAFTRPAVATLEDSGLLRRFIGYRLTTVSEHRLAYLDGRAA